jgi:hypothetical protein
VTIALRLWLVLVAAALGGCATTTVRDNSAFIAAAPRSILVVPVANRSLEVDAGNYLLASLAVPLAEKGYYVFPVNTTKMVLEQEGFYEGEQVHRQPPDSLARLFGADAILYVTINRWDAQYALLSTTVTVDFDYRIVSKDGTELWKANKAMQYTPQTNNSGHPLATLIVAMVNAALTRAKPNYMPLARQANQQVFLADPQGLPAGPYKPAPP